MSESSSNKPKKDLPRATQPSEGSAATNSAKPSNEIRASLPHGYDEIAFTAALASAGGTTKPPDSKVPLPQGDKIPPGYEEVAFTAATQKGKVPGNSEDLQLNPNQAYMTGNMARTNSAPSPTALQPPSPRHEQDLVRSDCDYQYPNVMQSGGKAGGNFRIKVRNFLSSTLRRREGEEEGDGPTKLNVNWSIILLIISILVAILALVISIAAIGVSASSRCDNCNLSTPAPSISANCTSEVIATCDLNELCTTSAVSGQITSSVFGCLVSTLLPVGDDTFSATLLDTGEGYRCQCHSNSTDVHQCNMVAIRC